jgi:hypothetical protein
MVKIKVGCLFGVLMGSRVQDDLEFWVVVVGLL